MTSLDRLYHVIQALKRDDVSYLAPLDQLYGHVFTHPNASLAMYRIFEAISHNMPDQFSGKVLHPITLAQYPIVPAPLHPNLQNFTAPSQQEHVARFHVAMDYVELMGAGESGRDLRRDLERASSRHRGS